MPPQPETADWDPQVNSLLANKANARKILNFRAFFLLFNYFAKILPLDCRAVRKFCLLLHDCFCGKLQFFVFDCNI